MSYEMIPNPPRVPAGCLALVLVVVAVVLAVVGVRACHRRPAAPAPHPTTATGRVA